MLLTCAAFLVSSILLTPNADFLGYINSYTFDDIPLYWAPQLAVARVDNFMTSSGTIKSDVWLGAVSLGNNNIAIFEINIDSDPEIASMEIISFPDNNNKYAYFTFDATFMQLPIAGVDESCLVVPIVEREDNPQGSDPAEGGNIMIVRLCSRDNNNDLVTIPDAFRLSGKTFDIAPEEIYHCAENPENTDYYVSLSGIDGDMVCVASFDQYCNQFIGDKVFVINEFYFAHNNNSVRCRPYEHFYFDENSNTAYLTNHNGGIAIWNYSSNDDTYLPIISRIALQQGGWGSSISTNGEELGDVHRAAVLECNQGPNLDSKLLFFGNLTMGIVVFDVTNPTNPNFVFQWDNDTKPYDWTSWHGAGTGLAPGESDFPAVVFGLDVRGYHDANDYIHVYACNGSDGLTTIDFTEFLCPWSCLNRSEFAALDEKHYSFVYSTNEFWAHDLRTFNDNSTIYVLTSWREPPDEGNHYSTSETGTIALVLYKDEIITPPSPLNGSSRGTQNSITTEPSELRLVASPNPAINDQILYINSNHQATCSLYIYDLSGRVIRNSHIQIEPGINLIEWTKLPGIPLSAGTYLLKITSSSGESLFEKSVILN